MKNFSFSKFLYLAGMFVLALGVVLGFAGFRGADGVAASFFVLVLWVIPSVLIASVFFALHKVIDKIDHFVIPVRRTEERLEKLLRIMEEKDKEEGN